MAGKDRRKPTIQVPPILPQPMPSQKCDATLQTVWHEQNWPLVLNLAKQRYKATKDPYYLAVEYVAKSFGDNPLDRVAGRDAVLKLVADSTGVVKDADTLDLYEFACSDARMDYPETIGVLRSRLVKAVPKDWSSSHRCLLACIYHSDWQHAQEITASMDKNFPGDKNNRVQNIFAAYMYSQSPACPAKSHELLAKLAKLKADKEFESRDLFAPAGASLGTRISAQETWLWLALQSTPQTSPKDTIAAIQKYAIKLLEYGLNDIFISAIRELQKLEAWGELYQICTQVLERAISIGQKEADHIDEVKAQLAQQRHAENKKKLSGKKSLGGDGESAQAPADTPDRTNDDKEDAIKLQDALDWLVLERSMVDNAYLSLGADPVVWSALINSVSKKENFSQSLKQTRKYLDKLMKAFRRSGEAKDLDHGRYDRAVLRILFLRDAQSAPSEAVSNTRIQHLIIYITKNYWDVSCFDSIKVFVETLNHEEVRIFFDELTKETMKVKDLHKSLALVTISLKIRYLLAASSKNATNCKCCDLKLRKDSVCYSCYTTIAESALQYYKGAIYNLAFREKVLPTKNGDPLSEFAIIGALSLLQLARISMYRDKEKSPLYSADIQYIFQAIAWLDSYLTAWPKNDPLRMLLIKLYLLIGCVSRAQTLWDKFDVKNVILEPLGSLFFDRISSIAPGIFPNGTSVSSNPMDKFINYYNMAIRRNIPKQTVDAFKHRNWESIPSMATFTNDLQRSCSLVMAVVEKHRGMRLRTGRSTEAIRDNPLICHLTLDHTLRDNTDYSYLPNFGGKDSVPTQVLVSHGPSLSSARAHLSWLAEEFVDFVSAVPNRDHKPSKPSSAVSIDHKYANDQCTRIGCMIEEAFTENSDLTGPEVHYYRIVLNLTKLTSDVFALYTLYAVSESKSEGRAMIEESIKNILAELKEQSDHFLDVPANYPSKIRAFHGFVALHAMGMLRESALVIKLTASFVTAALDKMKALEKSGRSNHNEFTWTSNQLKTLTSEAVAAEKQIEKRIKSLRELVQGGGWIERLHAWTFFDSTEFTLLGSAEISQEQTDFRKRMATGLKEAIGGQSGFEDWAGRVVESWQDLINGWSAVKLG
ncbi:hypothetical protein SLS62_009449 [Diatrype stigma]|uniref:Uncharacterized protein n=1 Tax=Diatrype stigma TaxID=117547 RepID=A0AAN9UL06_9PEZI